MAINRKKIAKQKTKNKKLKLVKSSRKKIKTKKKVVTKKSATKKRSKKSRKNNKLKSTNKKKGDRKMSAEAMKVSSVLISINNDAEVTIFLGLSAFNRKSIGLKKIPPPIPTILPDAFIDEKLNTACVVDPSEAQPIINYLERENMPKGVSRYMCYFCHKVIF